MAEGYTDVPRADNLFDVNHGVMQSVINDGLHIEKPYGNNVTAINIDTIHNENFYIYRINEGTKFSGTSPRSISDIGNSYILAGFSRIDSSSQLPVYGVQIAFGFNKSQILIRNRSFVSGGSAWGAWTQI